MLKNFVPACFKYLTAKQLIKAIPPCGILKAKGKINLSSLIRGALPLLLSFALAAAWCVPANAASQQEIDREVAVGRKVAEQVEQQFELISDPAAVVRLSMILERLTQNLDSGYPWQVKLIRLNELNAFCLPGGFIYFFSGMVDKLSSDAEIAAIMAHEIAHVVERHGVKQSARNTKLSLASLLVLVATGGAAAPAIAAQLASVAIMNSYSIDYEQEADIKAVKMLVDAGYPPAGIVTTMEKLMSEEIKQPIYNYGIYLSHPESRKRVEYLAKFLRDNRIPMNRKDALLVLRTAVAERGGKWVLLIDGTEVWSGPKNDDVLKILRSTAKHLDANLQMELAPYEIAADGGTLRIKNNIIVSKPLSGMSPLSEFRDKLIESITAAQRKHPIAKYFR